MRSLALAALALALALALPAQNQGLVLANGTSSFVDVPNSPTLTPTGGITVEAWVTYNSALASGWRFPTILRQDTSPNATSYFLRVEAGQTMANRMLWWVSTPSGNYTVNWFYPAGTLTSWTHIAATYDGSALRLFANGVQVAQAPGSGPILATNGIFRIGCGDLSISGGETWNGEIDEVRVWPFARSAAAIASTMNMRLASIPGEVSTWNLDGDATDSSGGNSGVGVGSPTFAVNTLALQQVAFPGAIAYGYGSGCHTNALAAVNSLANVGNQAFGFVGTRAPAGPGGFLVLGLGSFPVPIPLFGVDVFVDPSAGLLSFVTPAALGTAQLGLAIPNDPLLVGFAIHSQWAWFDASCASGWSASNAIVTAIVP